MQQLLSPPSPVPGVAARGRSAQRQRPESRSDAAETRCGARATRCPTADDAVTLMARRSISDRCARFEAGLSLRSVMQCSLVGNESRFLIGARVTTDHRRATTRCDAPRIPARAFDRREVREHRKRRAIYVRRKWPIQRRHRMDCRASLPEADLCPRGSSSRVRLNRDASRRCRPRPLNRPSSVARI